MTIVDEDAPFNPSPFFAWRPLVERDVVAATHRNIRSVILRPATVFGRGGSSSLLLLIRLAQQDRVARYIGTGENRWSSVHVDDLADLYVLALERADAGTVFNAAAGDSVSMRELAVAISSAVGLVETVTSWTLDQARAVLGPRADSFAMNQQISGAKATNVLGWSPQAVSLLDDVAYGSYRKTEVSTDK
jgi:nucleoside-diphosphate-sugar epimerase